MNVEQQVVVDNLLPLVSDMNASLKVRVKFFLCLTKYQPMKTYAVLN